MTKMAEKVKRLKDTIPKMTFGGKPVSLREFMTDTGGSGEIYDDMYGEILEAAIPATESDWEEVMDAVCPIVDEILIETVQVSPEIYHDLMMAIKYAHLRMMVKYHEEMVKEHEKHWPKPQLRIIKSDE